VIDSVLLVAQALPPVGAMLLAAYLLLGVPLSFGAAAVALVIALARPLSGRAARLPGVLALVLGMVNIALAVVWSRMDENPSPLGADGAVFVALLIATPLLGGIAIRRAGQLSS